MGGHGPIDTREAILQEIEKLIDEKTIDVGKLPSSFMASASTERIIDFVVDEILADLLTTEGISSGELNAHGKRIEALIDRFNSYRIHGRP